MQRKVVSSHRYISFMHLPLLVIAHLHAGEGNPCDQVQKQLINNTICYSVTPKK